MPKHATFPHAQPAPAQPVRLTRQTAALLAAALLCSSTALAAPPQAAPKPPKGHAAVVTIHHDASDAGLAILQQGGNAVDAAVAVGFALAVVWPRAGNLGGGGFMLIRDAKGEAHFLDFRERAPLAATQNMYLDAGGNVIPGLSTTGYKAIGVPGSVKGLVYAQQHFGKLTLAQDMAPAIRLATEGYVLSGPEAATLHDRKLAQFPESKRIFQQGGDFMKAGDTFKQPDLARTLTRIAAAPDDFYHGAIATELAHSISSHGGLITTQDLANYAVIDRKPLLGTFTTHGEAYDIVTSPPPSSGGILLIETLHMLSTPIAGKTLADVGSDRSPAQVHLITEAFRRAYMDRADYLGDPDYNTLPIAQMASAKYAEAWASSIDPAKPTPSADLKRPAGFLPPPPTAKSAGESNDTTHYSIIDAAGMTVATTYTLNGLFGCGATAEGLGVLLNNEMDDFTSKPGAPNAYKMIQSSANAIAPGHRPLSSMTPTIVTTHATPGHPAKPVLVLGSPGGSTIPATVINDLLSILVNHLTVQQSADAPRFYHQYLPDTLQFEKAFPHDVVEAMRSMGYTVSQTSVADTSTSGVWGDSELIAIDPKTGVITGANDSRFLFGKAAFY